MAYGIDLDGHHACQCRPPLRAMMKNDTALVVGASRGIGLALTRRILDGWPEVPVLATCRDPSSPPPGLTALHEQYGERLRLFRCELRDDNSIAQFAQQLRKSEFHPSLVLHCAGVLHDEGIEPEKALSQLRRSALARVFDINTFAPILLAQAVLPLIPRNCPTHFAALSAMVGSVGDNRLGGWYSYRASKTALNQLLKTLAIECRRTHPDLCITAIHPGTTDTDLSRPFQRGIPADRLYPPELSAARILEVVTAGCPQDSGRFMNWNGEPIPW